MLRFRTARIVAGATLALCPAGWVTLAVLSVPPADESLSLMAHRYLSAALTAVTVCAALAYVGCVLYQGRGEPMAGDRYEEGYAAGYSDGLNAGPAALRPVPDDPYRRRVKVPTSAPGRSYYHPH